MLVFFVENNITVPETEGCQRMETMICDLPNDLLSRILSLIPTKDAVATSILSKRWRYIWTMLTQLEFEDESSESVGWFTESSLQLHKAPKLWSLTVKLGPRCPVDVDVGKWIQNAVDRRVLYLDFSLLWTAKPTSFPKCLYTCDTLVLLTLSNEILVDVSPPVRLPSLVSLSLLCVVYKDMDSLVWLLHGSPALEDLMVERREADNLTNFVIKSSLATLLYTGTERKYEEEDDGDFGLLIIDCPALTNLSLYDVADEYCVMENTSCLDEAFIDFIVDHDDNLLSSLSSVIHLYLSFSQSMVVCCCNTIKFSRLSELYFLPDISLDWLEPFMFLLQNSPILKTLTIQTDSWDSPPSWNQPISVPGCLSSHLEIFKWGGYRGREDETQLVKYILANSKCLHTVEMSLITTCNPEERGKEIASLPRISTSSQLLFPNQMEWSFNGKNLSSSSSSP